MKTFVMFVFVLLFAMPCYGQGSNPLDKWTNRFAPDSRKPAADLRANRFDPDSLSNPFGAGSPFKTDGLNNPYSQYGSRYSNDSWRNPYATNAPKLYSDDGTYRGRLSANRYDPDSTSNPYGQYGSRYSPDSINNPYGTHGRYSTQPIYVYPR